MSISNDGNCCESSIAGNAFTDFSGASVNTQDLFAVNARINNLTGINIVGTDATYTNIRGTMITGTNIRCDPGQYAGQLGSRFAPLYSFNSNIDSGMYSTASEVIIASDATDIIGCTSNQLNVYKPLRGNNNQPYAKYAQNVLNGGSLTAATINKVLFPGLISPTQNNPVSYSSGDFTIQYTGIYHIHFQMQSTESVSGIRDFYITLNDNVPTNAGTISRLRLDGQVGGIKVLTWTGKLSLNDVIRCWYFTTQNNNYGDTAMPRPEVSFYLLS